MTENNIKSRKSDHIRINLENDVDSKLSNGLEDFQFIHNALPELKLEDVDLSQEIFKKRVSFPLLISSMTGGTDQALRINQTLAVIAEQCGLAMGVGSQRAAIDDPMLAKTFHIRDLAPNILLFANLGAVQLNYGYGIEECKKAVDMIQADGLIFHLNPLQEALQPEGDTDFSGLLNKIETIAKQIPVPVVVKEVGWGVSAEVARRLINVGVSGIDVSGAGGTSWSQVERFRLSDENDIQVAESFINWGIPTADALVAIRKEHPGITIFASGGLKNGMDVAKSLALGANLTGMAGALLKAAVVSEEHLLAKIKVIERIVRISMFVTGSKDLASFSNHKLVKIR
jgi:isopentenyl-diphosphate delta-isomerase